MPIEEETVAPGGAAVGGGNAAVLRDIVASVAGSAACTYTGQPFDTVKVRMQAGTVPYSGPVDCLLKSVRAEGVTALWRGSVPAFLGALNENAVCFGINGHLERLFASQSLVSNPDLKPFALGAMTGLLTAAALCPFDVIKCRSQVNTDVVGSSGSFSSILRHILRSGGPRALYTGIVAQTATLVPFYALFFGSYKLCCDQLKRRTALPESAVFFISGGLAGQISWAVTLPLDAVKTTIQVHSGPLPTPRIRDVVRGVWGQHGLSGFYRGLSAAVVRAFPANAALFVGYEWTKMLLS